MIETTPGAGTSDQDAGSNAGGAGGGEEVAKLRSDNTRLRQQLAETEQTSARAVPYVRIAQALIQAPGGKEIVEKLNKGEALTATEEKTVQKAAGNTATEAAEAADVLTVDKATELFKGMLNEAVGQMGETVAAERKAAENLSGLEARGEKELEGFKHLKRDPQYQRQVNDVIAQIGDGTIEVPKEEEDVWWFAMKTAHTVVNAMRNAGTPKGKGKKSDSERVAEAIAAGGAGPSSTTQTGDSDIPEELKGTIEGIRKLGTRTIAGKSFGNPKMNK